MFTTPCFIRKNTPELWNKLKTLGYKPTRIFLEDSYLCIATAVTSDYAYFTAISEDMLDTTDPHATWDCAGRIDCGTNEELFLAIAALRDDSDEEQYFTNGKEWRKLSKNILWQQDSFTIECHKATVEELIEHFK